MSWTDEMIDKYRKQDPNFDITFNEEKVKLELEYSLMKAREEKGFSQRELAKKMNKPQSTVVRLENGQTDPKLSTIFSIARALGKKVKITLV
ncbi:MAG: helix-turn-helix transcriptional regulator [Lachnospiraceae bacterium]|jgi:predicted transcriptional regulator|nr:helix-turn-helix transcriptional regulator [Lachnospiraceae bacterium]